ncbi:unnamed protein product [Oikopleura dioica]|uniref:Uncharacterized protein n=1 Tax=Oikopleura dioica TaxID=34765 RepID=E4X3T2_OIKDI|nr:unnamed protein product [Oikopleura dioica]
MRAMLFHLPLLRATLEQDTAGEKNSTTKFLKNIILPLFDAAANKKEVNENRFTIMVAAIPMMAFFPAIKDFHAIVSPTQISLGEVLSSMEKLELFFLNVIGRGADGCFDRLLVESEKDETTETKGACAYLRDWMGHMTVKQLADLDNYASASMCRSHEKHERELVKWRPVGEKFPAETNLTATSRQVESSFATLKSIERSLWSMKARRVFVIAQTKFNKTTEWMDKLEDKRQREVISTALLERAENEKAAKNLEKQDMVEATGIEVDDMINNELVEDLRLLNAAENDETDEEQADEEEDEEEDDVFGEEQNELNELDNPLLNSAE